MDFPSTYEILRYQGGFLISGPAFLLLAVFCLIAWVIRIRRGDLHWTRKLWRERRIGMAAIILMAVAALHLQSYRQIFNALSFRFDPSEISAIRVTKYTLYDTEPYRRPVGEPVLVSDTALIEAGFRKLADAKSFHTNHESYGREAFRIEFKLKGAEQYSDRTLWLYDETSKHINVDVVVPVIGPQNLPTRSGGEYSSTEFHKWFDCVVRPKLLNHVLDSSANSQPQATRPAD